MRRLPDVAYRIAGRFSVSRFDRWLHPLLYRATGGRWILGRTLGCETILLTTVGHRTGRERTVALYAFADGDRWVVVASRGGSAHLPGWYHNLAAWPAVAVQHRAARWSARASVAEEPERSRLWALVNRSYPGYDLYQQATPYAIPVVVLAREASA